MRLRAENKLVYPHSIRHSNFNTYFRLEIMKLSNSFLNDLKYICWFVFFYLRGRKQVGISSFYRFYKIRISPFIFRPETMNLFNSFLNVLKVFVDEIPRVPGVETSWLNNSTYLHFITLTEFEFRP